MAQYALSAVNPYAITFTAISDTALACARTWREGRGRKMAMFKRGDKVTVHDGSWAYAVSSEGIKRTTGEHLENRVFCVYENNADIPVHDFLCDKDGILRVDGKVWTNNLILVANDNNEVVFINESLVKPWIKQVKQCTCSTCPVCGGRRD
jgi:hypothetical protein